MSVDLNKCLKKLSVNWSLGFCLFYRNHDIEFTCQVSIRHALGKLFPDSVKSGVDLEEN